MAGKQNKSRSTVVVFVGFLIVAAIVVYFSWFHDSGKGDSKSTLYNEVIARDFSKNYPQTPAEVVKAYCEIVKCMYSEVLTEDQIFTLCGQMRALYSEELLKNNPMQDMLYKLSNDIAEYRENDMKINSFLVEPAEDIDYIVVDDRKRANVEFQITVKGSDLVKLSEELLLEEDKDRNYKIIGWRTNET